MRDECVQGIGVEVWQVHRAPCAGSGVCQLLLSHFCVVYAYHVLKKPEHVACTTILTKPFCLRFFPPVFGPL